MPLLGLTGRGQVLRGMSPSVVSAGAPIEVSPPGKLTFRLRLTAGLRVLAGDFLATFRCIVSSVK